MMRETKQEELNLEKLKPIGFNDPSAVAFRRQHNISDDIGAGC